MLVRGVLCRLAADAPKSSAQDLPQLARFLQQSILRGNAFSVTTSRALSRLYKATLTESRRSYATARATKPATTTKKPAAKKAAPAKKATAKKTTAATKSRATKSKAAPKKKTTKKAAKPKPKPKSRRKKVPTPEQKQKELVKELKLKALKEPVTGHPLNAYSVFLQSKLKGHSGQVLTEVGKVSEEFKSLTVAQREHWNHVTHEANTARQAEYKAWINTHTPAEIREANNARRRLRALAPASQKKRPKHTAPIHDERQVARPISSYIQFSIERQASGDFKGIPITQSAVQIGKEWKALTAGERQKYDNAAKASLENYAKEAERVYKP